MVETRDSRKYKTVVTDLGKEKIAAAALEGWKVNIVTAVVGDGGGAYYIPTPDQTELRGEQWRGDIAAKRINSDSPNMIDIKVVVPRNVGGFTVREMGVLDDQGDLIAVCNTPDTEKAVILEGIAATLTLIMHIVVVDTTVLEFAIDPTLDPVPYEEFVELQTAHEKLLLEIMQGEVTAPLATNTGTAITTQDDAAIVAVKKI